MMDDEVRAMVLSRINHIGQIGIGDLLEQRIGRTQAERVLLRMADDDVIIRSVGGGFVRPHNISRQSRKLSHRERRPSLLSVLLEKGEATPASAIAYLGWKNQGGRQEHALAFELDQLHHWGVVVLDADRGVYVLHPVEMQKQLLQQRAYWLAKVKLMDEQLMLLRPYLLRGFQPPKNMRKPGWKRSGRGVVTTGEDLTEEPRRKRGRSR